MSKRIRFMAELTNGWHLRLRRRLSLKSGRLGGVRYDAGINLAKGGASLSGSVGPLTVNVGVRGITLTWRLGTGVAITRHLSFRRLFRLPDDPNPADWVDPDWPAGEHASTRKGRAGGRKTGAPARGRTNRRKTSSRETNQRER